MNLGPVKTTRMIINMRVAELVGGPNAVIERAKRVLAPPPPTGTNTVLVAHGNLMQAATGAYSGEAGARLFSTQSFDATTTLQIAREAEVTEPLLHYYFRGKDDQITCLIENIFAK